VLGFITAPLGRVFVMTSIRYLPVAEVGMVTLLQIFITAIAAWMVFREIPNTSTFAGGSVIVLTLAAHNMIGRREASRV